MYVKKMSEREAQSFFISTPWGIAARIIGIMFSLISDAKKHIKNDGYWGIGYYQDFFRI